MNENGRFVLNINKGDLISYREVFIVSGKNSRNILPSHLKLWCYREDTQDQASFFYYHEHQEGSTMHEVYKIFYVYPEALRKFDPPGEIMLSTVRDLHPQWESISETQISTSLDAF